MVLRFCIPPDAVQRKARDCPLASCESPTTTEPVADTSYAWLPFPPNVPSQITLCAVPPPPPPLPLALRREVKVPSQRARAISKAAQGRIFLVTVTLLATWDQV